MMAENSGIEWTHHTFNPWIGCQRVSPACDHCYAEEWDKRYSGGNRWGAKAARTRTSPSNLAQPMRWNRKAFEQKTRFRVFCASLADVFDNKVPSEWRSDLWALIRETPNLDWLLLTKRPQNMADMLPGDWEEGYHNVWLGVTVENRQEADRRIPILLETPAAIRFLSCEPLLENIHLGYLGWPLSDKSVPRCGYNALIGAKYENGIMVKKLPRLDWVITGGESGKDFRPANIDWFRNLRDQCESVGIPFLFKQYEGKSQTEIKKLGRKLDGVIHDGYPVIK